MKIKALLDEGAIGRVLSARSHWGEYLPGWHPWEDYRQGYAARSDLGGGVVLTLCHPLDYLRWLLGEVSSLWAFTSHLSDLEITVEDTAEIGLQFASGVLSSLHLDYFQQPPAHTLSLTGAHGMIRWDNQDGIVQLFRSGSQSWEQYPPAPGFERNWLFMDQIRHFVEVTSGTASPRCTLQDGIQALRLALAVHHSSSQSVQVQF
jgi:predicted dehydrogenase